LLAVLLLAMAPVIAIAPLGRADLETCPAVCDRIPSSAWPDSSALPLDSGYHWPMLSRVATPVAMPRFQFEDICARPPAPDERTFAVTARAEAGQPDDQWRLQAQVVHWRGETWRTGQWAASVFDAAAAALRACQVTAPPFSPSITTAEPNRLAAVISGPVIVHQYLLVDPRSGTITEVAFSTTAEAGSAAMPWPAWGDGRVFDAISARLCTAYLGSCG
jgi:hypothetical protein